MFLPEYTITTGILKNITSVEYARAVIENTTILPRWKKQLEKEVLVKFVQSVFGMEGMRVPETLIKKIVDGLKGADSSFDKNLQRVLALNNAVSMADTELNLDENVLKGFYQAVMPNNKVTYRQSKVGGKIPPEEILAEVVELMDWYNSLDARETHPILRAGILRAWLVQLMPFENVNETMAGLVSAFALTLTYSEISKSVCLEEFYTKSWSEYTKAITSIDINEGDLTEWLEFYTGAFASQAFTAKEKILLLARDTKVAKVSGSVEITFRQERIVEYLQDYGLLQNRNFESLFPDISEDSVLRDLKALMDKGIVVKRGKTKSSRYELR